MFCAADRPGLISGGFGSFGHIDGREEEMMRRGPGGRLLFRHRLLFFLCIVQVPCPYVVKGHTQINDLNVSNWSRVGYTISNHTARHPSLHQLPPPKSEAPITWPMPVFKLPLLKIQDSRLQEYLQTQGSVCLAESQALPSSLEPAHMLSGKAVPQLLAHPPRKRWSLDSD